MRNVRTDYSSRYYKPRGVPLSSLEEIILSKEDLEVLRLRYIDRKSQTEAAKAMNISQSQYQRDLTNVLERLVRALFRGDAIRIE